MKAIILALLAGICSGVSSYIYDIPDIYERNTRWEDRPPFSMEDTWSIVVPER